MYTKRMSRLPERKNYRNLKNRLLLNYFMIKAGNDNKKIKLDIQNLINTLTKLNL